MKGKRLSKENWLEEGFKLLSEFAQDKLRILYLCERLGVTRGSFYHHFSGIEDYVQQLMEQWEKENTLRLIKGSNEGATAEERGELLAQLVAERNQTVEAAIRSWSFYHPIVKKHLQKVDEIRLAFLKQLFEEIGVEGELAELRAQLDYATLIGIQQLFPNISKEQMQALWEVQRSISLKK